MKVLLVSLDNLGDLVFASSLAAPLQGLGHEVSLFCKEYSSPIASLIPGLRQVFAADPFWDTAPGRPKGSFAAFLRALSGIRSAGFDSAVVASRSWRPRLAARACGIAKVVSLSGAGDERRPVLEDLASLLAPFGAAGPLRCRLDASLLPRPRHSRPWAALHPFAGDSRRCLSPAAWAEIARGLRAQGFQPVWIGAPEETRRLAGVREEGDRVCHGLLDAAAEMAASSLFVGHDSGPLHVANALGVPCVGIYAPGQPRRTFPQGIGPYRMVEGQDPTAISAGDVLTAGRALLSI